MYETPNLDFARAETLECTELRPLVWPELVARFAAMRDFRRSLSDIHAQTGGAFSGFADIREELSNEAHVDDSENYEAAVIEQKLNEIDRGVNLKTSAAGKCLARKDRDQVHGINPVDRETS
jgi:hypothetical protein